MRGGQRVHAKKAKGERGGGECKIDVQSLKTIRPMGAPFLVTSK